jgi:hypothetical protein
LVSNLEITSIKQKTNKKGEGEGEGREGRGRGRRKEWRRR